MDDQMASFQQQHWEFRTTGGDDSDSSSDDSRQILPNPAIPIAEKPKLVSNPIPIINDDNTRGLQQKENVDKPQVLEAETEIKTVKAKKPRKIRKPAGEVSNNKKRKNATTTTKGVKKKKKIKIDDNAGLDDLKKFMESLLEGLKVTRESLLTWMKEEMPKLSANDSDTEREKNESVVHRNTRNVHYEKNVVLAMEAPNCRAKMGLAKGKKTLKSIDHNHQPDRGFEKIENESKTFFDIPSTNFTTQNQFSHQVDSLSMYSNVPMFDNNPSVNYFQPRVEASFNSGRQQSQMINPNNALYGYHNNHSEEQINSRMINCLDRYRIVPALSIPSDHGMFNIPSHVGLENLSQEIGNGSGAQGLRMSGGAIKLSRGSYGLEEHHVANYLHGHLNY